MSPAAFNSLKIAVPIIQVANCGIYLIGGFTIEIYTIFKPHFKVFLNKFLKNEKVDLVVQKPSNLCILSKF
jgi:hypothetical protein